MNIYAVDGGDMQTAVYIERESNVGYWEYWHALAIIRAASRGQARAIAAQMWDTEFTHPMRITLLYPDAAGQPGDLTDKHSSVWWLYNRIFNPDVSTLEFIGWEL